MCFLGVLLSSVFHTSFWIFLFAIITSFSNYQCGGLVEVMAHIYLFHGLLLHLHFSYFPFLWILTSVFSDLLPQQIISASELVTCSKGARERAGSCGSWAAKQIMNPKLSPESNYHSASVTSMVPKPTVIDKRMIYSLECGVLSQQKLFMCSNLMNLIECFR